MRARRYQTTNTDFVATAVLVPAGKQAYRCGTRNLALTSFHPGDKAVRFHTRTLPDHEYSAVLPVQETNEYWHTYGVEVTRKRISWFVDGVVRATERRPGALSGIRFALRLELTAIDGATMNKSRLQVVVEGATDTPAPRVRAHAHLEVGHVPVVLDGAAELGAADHAIAIERQPVSASVVGARLQHGVAERRPGAQERVGPVRPHRGLLGLPEGPQRGLVARVHLLDPDHADTLPGPAGPGNGITSSVRRCHARPMEDEEFTPLPEDWSRALAIVAHPDDLEFGAAAAIARWTGQGKHITYVMVTSGEAGIDGLAPEESKRVREAEQIESARIVGVDTVEFLGFKDGVVEYGLELRAAIAKVVRQHQPEIVITGNFRDTFGGVMLNQADHIAVGRAVVDAVRDAGNRWIFSEQLVDGLEPWGGVTAVWAANSPDGKHAVETTETFDKGVASLAAHKAYIDGLGWENFDPSEFLEGFSRQTGQRLGVPMAAAFEVYPLRSLPPPFTASLNLPPICPKAPRVAASSAALL